MQVLGCVCQPRYSGSNCSTPLPIYGYSALDPVGGDGGDGALYAGNILDRSITPIMMMVAGILISITILTGVTVYLFVRYRHRFQQMKHQQSSNYYSETGGGALDHLDQLSAGDNGGGDSGRGEGGGGYNDSNHTLHLPSSINHLALLLTPDYPQLASAPALVMTATSTLCPSLGGTRSTQHSTQRCPRKVGRFLHSLNYSLLGIQKI